MTTFAHFPVSPAMNFPKPTGVIGIVNFKKDGGGPGPAMEERVDPEQVIAEARAAGLELRKRENFLRYQYLLTFGLPSR